MREKSRNNYLVRKKSKKTSKNILNNKKINSRKKKSRKKTSKRKNKKNKKRKKMKRKRLSSNSKILIKSKYKKSKNNLLNRPKKEKSLL